MFTVEVKKKCPWYFTLKRLISERPNLVPVGLGNNTTDYNTSILLDQGSNEAGPSNAGANPLDSLSDEPKEITEDLEIEGDTPSSDTKATTKGKKTAVKKEHVVPAKRARSQVDRIADTEVARLECQKVKFEAKQERIKSLAGVASVKAQEKSHMMVEIRQAELDLERERMKLNHEYRLEALKRGHVIPPSFQDSHSQPTPSYTIPSQPYPAMWPPSSPFPISQPFPGSDSQPSSQPYIAPHPSVGFKVPPLESFPMPPSGDSESGQDRSPNQGQAHLT